MNRTTPFIFPVTLLQHTHIEYSCLLCRFTNSEDKEWFRNTLQQTAENLLAEDFKYYDPEETYFVNFLREPPEPTGFEPEDLVLEAPRIYEQIPR